MADEPRSRLGRGLAALIGEISETPEPVARTGQAGSGAPRRLPIEHVRPSPRNPRRAFIEEGLEDLTASIREKGIIQPIVVRALSTPDAFEIVAGERRWRAAQRAGLHEVPVVLLELTDREALEVAIIENVQRADLNAVEEAQGYEALMEEFAYTQADLAKVIGKSRSHIANTLRLLKLPASVKGYVEDGRLTAGHARALLAHDDPEKMALEVVEKGLNVRDVEALAKPAVAGGASPARPAKVAVPKSADIVALERRLADALGMVVSIESRGESGDVRLRYATLEQLDDILRRLGVE